MPKLSVCPADDPPLDRNELTQVVEDWGLLDPNAVSWGRFLKERAEAGEPSADDVNRMYLHGTSDLNRLFRSYLAQRRKVIDLEDDNHWKQLLEVAPLLAMLSDAKYVPQDRIHGRKKSPWTTARQTFSAPLWDASWDYSLIVVHAVISGVWPSPPTVESEDGTRIRIDAARNVIAQDIRRYFEEDPDRLHPVDTLLSDADILEEMCGEPATCLAAEMRRHAAFLKGLRPVLVQDDK